LDQADINRNEQVGHQTIQFSLLLKIG